MEGVEDFSVNGVSIVVVLWRCGGWELGAYDWTWRKGSSDMMALNEYIDTKERENN